MATKHSKKNHGKQKPIVKIQEMKTTVMEQTPVQPNEADGNNSIIIGYGTKESGH
jgi:hypothetical protein